MQHKKGGIDRTMTKEYLPQLHQRICGYKFDLEAFLRVISELTIDPAELPDVKKKQTEVISDIKVYIYAFSCSHYYVFHFKCQSFFLL